jgi:transcriptional regulator with XRE-family HTH domain
MARRLRRPISPQQALGRAVTRKARPYGTGGTADQVRRLEGTLGRQETARRLGVSDRTLRRYRAGGTPSRANAARLAEETRTAPEVRRAAVNPRRESRLRNRGAYVRMTGDIGVTRDPRYKRRRTIGESSPIHLDGPVMAEILDAYELGDDNAALELLREALDDEYVGGITFDDLNSLEFLRDDPTM